MPKMLATKQTNLLNWNFEHERHFCRRLPMNSNWKRRNFWEVRTVYTTKKVKFDITVVINSNTKFNYDNSIFLYPGNSTITPGTPKSDSGPGSRFIDTVKKAWSARVKQSPSVENNLNTNGHERLSKKGSQPTISESTPSVRDLEKKNNKNKINMLWPGIEPGHLWSHRYICALFVECSY